MRWFKLTGVSGGIVAGAMGTAAIGDRDWSELIAWGMAAVLWILMWAAIETMMERRTR